MPMKVRYTTINGQVMAENRGSVRKLYVPDPLGSTVAMIDDTQTVTDTFSYWPYGEIASRTGTTATTLQYVGTLGYYAGGTGRSYVRSRYLDSGLGCWITRDPAAGTRMLEGLYTYANANPTSLSDRSGLSPFCDSCAQKYGAMPVYQGWQSAISAAIKKYCKNCPNITPKVITCMIFQETNGDNNDVTSGNYGIGQVSYGDWKDYCQGLGTWKQIQNNPILNIECAIKFLCQYKPFGCDPHKRGTSTGPNSEYTCCMCCS